jgi:hypothetical protein
MIAHKTRTSIVAGALASATIAFAGTSGAQIVTIPTTSTTSTTAAPTTTTTAAATTTSTSATTTTTGDTTTTTAGGTTTTTTAATTTTIATSPTSTGGVSISAPNEVTLSSASLAAGSTSGSLGLISVSDTRGALAGGWTVKVSASAFTTGSGSAAETIPAGSVYYWSGVATSTSGAGLFTPGQANEVAAQSLASMRTAYTAATTGSSSASWRPTIEVRFPTGAVAGQYSGTIVHSVA